MVPQFQFDLTTSLIAGIVLLAQGVSLLLMRKASRTRQILAGFVVSGVSISFLSILFPDTPLYSTLALAAGIPLAILSINRSELLVRCTERSGRFLREPVYWVAAMVVTGTSLIALSAAYSETTNCDLLDESKVNASGIGSMPPAFREDAIQNAVTDRGNRIPLFFPEHMENVDFAQADESISKRYLQDQQLIRVDSPAPNVNCHGWVFTKGQFWIRGQAVDLILADNGYVGTSQPEPGDIVIYRDEAGTITHSGVVRTVLDGGHVLVESKWGALGTYLHFVEHSPYGAHFQVLRSSRTSHVLKGLPIPGEARTPSDQI